MFLNRKQELSYLEQHYQRQRAKIAVIYGRRRVGKSTLVHEWSKDKRHIFFFAQRLDSATLLGQFSRELARVMWPEKVISPDFSDPDWEAAFRTGGGFFLFYAPPERQEQICRALPELKPVKFHLAPQGSKVIYVEESGYQP